MTYLDMFCHYLKKPSRIIQYEDHEFHENINYGEDFGEESADSDTYKYLSLNDNEKPEGNNNNKESSEIKHEKTIVKAEQTIVNTKNNSYSSDEVIKTNNTVNVHNTTEESISKNNAINKTSVNDFSETNKFSDNVFNNSRKNINNNLSYTVKNNQVKINKEILQSVQNTEIESSVSSEKSDNEYSLNNEPVGNTSAKYISSNTSSITDVYNEYQNNNINNFNNEIKEQSEAPQVRIGQINVLINDRSTKKNKKDSKSDLDFVKNEFGLRGL